MTKTAIRISVLVIFLLCLSGSDAKAQSETQRLEVGGQFQLIGIDPPLLANGGGSGFGGHFTYNLNSHLGFEAEINYFSCLCGPKLSTGFRKMLGETEGLVGLRAGLATPRGGMFLKARPGFIHFPEGSDAARRDLSPLNHFALDLGFVGMRYFRNHTYARFDAGDTIVTSGSISRLGAVNNPQVSIGLGIHF